jgi:hypothetical protein
MFLAKVYYKTSLLIKGISKKGQIQPFDCSFRCSLLTITPMPSHSPFPWLEPK